MEAGRGAPQLDYSEDQAALDDRGIDMSVEEVVELPMSGYTNRMRTLKLSPQDAAFVKSLRRRIKNRMASQNSRRRNMEHLRSLADELHAVRSFKRDLNTDRAALTRQRASITARLMLLYNYVSQKLKERGDDSELPIKPQRLLQPRINQAADQVFQTNFISNQNPQTNLDISPQPTDLNKIKEEVFKYSMESLVKQSVNHMFKFDRSKIVDGSESLEPRHKFRRMFVKGSAGVKRQRFGKNKTVNGGKRVSAKKLNDDLRMETNEPENLVITRDSHGMDTEMRLNESETCSVSARNLNVSENCDSILEAEPENLVVEGKLNIVSETHKLVAQICRVNNLVIEPCQVSRAQISSNGESKLENHITKSENILDSSDLRVKKSVLLSRERKMIRAKCVTIKDSILENNINRIKNYTQSKGCIMHTSDVLNATFTHTDNKLPKDIVHHENKSSPKDRSSPKDFNAFVTDSDKYKKHTKLPDTIKEAASLYERFQNNYFKILLEKSGQHKHTNRHLIEENSRNKRLPNMKMLLLNGDEHKHNNGHDFCEEESSPSGKLQNNYIKILLDEGGDKELRRHDRESIPTESHLNEDDDKELQIHDKEGGSPPERLQNNCIKMLINNDGDKLLRSHDIETRSSNERLQNNYIKMLLEIDGSKELSTNGKEESSAKNRLQNIDMKMLLENDGEKDFNDHISVESPSERLLNDYYNVFLKKGCEADVACGAGRVLNLCVKECASGGRRHHGRKQAAPRRVACVGTDVEDRALDLKVKNVGDSA